MNTEQNNYLGEGMVAGEKQVVTDFQDAGPVEVHGSNTNNSIIANNQPDVQLAKFLERPVLIISLTNETAATTYQPWELYLENVAVTAKLQNYKGIRATLNLRFTQAGMPFVYGQYGWAYGLQEEGSETYSFRGLMNSGMSIIMDPSVSEPQELRIPHVWRYPFIDLKNDDNILNGKRQGYIRNQVICPYLRADAVGTPVVGMSVFAWLTDVELFGATSENIVYQSNEYKGSISKPASVVAKIAGMLTEAPVIGIFARAVQLGSGALASIANLFGYSKPVLIHTVEAMFNQEHRNMFTSSGLDVANKLTYDIKQENSIGAGYIIGDDGDALSFKNIASRPCYLRDGTSIAWNTTDVVGTMIYSTPVMPGIFNGVSTPVLSAVGMVCAPFKYWRGTLIYRIRMNCSQYHRGRLRVLWSPNPLTIPLVTDLSNVVESCIIDIVNNKVIDVEVNWGCMEPFKAFGVMGQTTGILTTGDWVHDQYDRCNGYLYFQVLQQLTAPYAGAALNPSIEIFAGNDFAVAVPTNDLIQVLHTTVYNAAMVAPTVVAYPGFNTVTPGNIALGIDTYPPVRLQSNEYSSQAPKPILRCSLNSSIGDAASALRMQFGESFVSFRPMLKAYHMYQQINVESLGGGVDEYFLAPFIPIRTENYPTNLQPFRFQNIITWMGMMFKLRRGGIRYKVVMTNVVPDLDITDGEHVMVSSRCRYGDNTAEGHLNPASDSQTAVYNLYKCKGVAMSDSSPMPTLSFEIPYQLVDSFLKNQTTVENNSNPYVPYYDGAIVSFTNASGTVYTLQVFISGAEDMTFDWFGGTPILYMWNPINYSDNE